VIARSYPFAQDATLRSDSATDTASLGNTYILVGNAACAGPTTTTIEDNNPSVAYGNGWHLVNNSSASDGHFRLQSGKGNAVVTFNVDAGRTGKITYNYATSTKGGSAEILLDGASKGTVTYSGNNGSLQSPVFGASVSYANLSSGQHRLEIRPTKGAVYIDGFTLDSASSFGEPTSGPGTTSSGTNTIGAGQELVQNLSAGPGTQAISVVAATNTAVPLKLVLVSPSGGVIATSDASGGVAVIDAPVSAQGLYVLKVMNVGLGPVQVWTAATPLMTR
jgi:hypothetical protein